MWKSKIHDDGTMFDGYFIAGIETPAGQATYHSEMKYWSLFEVREVPRAPVFDGHTSADVVERIKSLSNERAINITSTSRRKEVQENYSTLYKILDSAMAARLRELPVSAFVDTLVDDHTGTKFRFETACLYDGFANCLEVYTATVEMTIFSGVACISAADWVNLRDAMTLMMSGITDSLQAMHAFTGMRSSAAGK